MIIIYWIKCKLQKAELDLKITNKISMRGSRKVGGRGA